MFEAWLALAPLFVSGVEDPGAKVKTESVEWVAFDPLAVPVRRVTANPTASHARNPDEKLIYSNTEGKFLFSLSPNSIIADDMTFVAKSGCKLRRFTFRVRGKAHPDGAGGPFQVQYGLYPICPNASPSTPAIAGTTGTVDFTDDSVIHEIEHMVPADVDVELFPTVYLGLKSNRANVGVVAGAPALVGFSVDRVDTSIFPCNSSAGGFPVNPHASYYAEFFGDETCVDTFPGYVNHRPAFLGYSNNGANRCFADDVQLATATCSMIGLDIGVRVSEGAAGGTIQVRVHEDANGLPGAMLGPYRQASVAGAGTHMLRWNYDPPVSLNSDRVWVSYQASASTVGWIVTRQQADLGATERTFARSASGQNCAITDDWQILDWHQAGFAPETHMGFELTIHCQGEAPKGACCDMVVVDEAGDGVCREVPWMNCPFPAAALGSEDRMQRLWIEGEACEPEPFGYPCGTSACCTPQDTCENLTHNQCRELVPPGANYSWQPTQFCDEPDQKCLFFSCLQRKGDCAAAHGMMGCRRPPCCQIVCEADPWCCHAEWDLVCLRERQTGTGCHFFDLSPANEVCFVTSDGIYTAYEMGTNDSVIVDHQYVSQRDQRSGMSCHPDDPVGTIRPATWYWFEAKHTTARMNTCDTFPHLDTVVALYGTTDPSAPCHNLYELACSNDSHGCAGGMGSDLCVDGLVLGEHYFIQVTIPKASEMGFVQLNVESPCPGLNEKTTVTGRTSIGRDLQTSNAAVSVEPDAQNDQFDVIRRHSPGRNSSKNESAGDTECPSHFDSNRRCTVDLNDYWRFRNCMLGGRPGAPSPHEACIETFDANGDGKVDLLDFRSFANAFTGSN